MKTSSSPIVIAEARARQVSLTDDALSVNLVDGRTITVPLTWYPRLAHGSHPERLFASSCNQAVSNPCMAKALRAGIVAAISIAVLAIATGVNGQTKDSPLLLYKGGSPLPKTIKTVIPKYPTGAQPGSMVLELTLRPDGKVDAVTAIRPLPGATKAAIAATKQWQYEPVFYRGKPAWAVLDIRICNPWPCRPSVTRPSTTRTQ